MNTSKVINHIVSWLKSYSIKSKTNGFVVGISGGIDSAVTSTLACMTGLPTLCIQMPIFQSENELLRSGKHIKWLNKFENFEEEYIDLTKTFESFSKSVSKDHKNDKYTFNTDGKNLYSNDLLIGFTKNDKKIIYDYTAYNNKFISYTCSRHINMAKKYCDIII